MLTLNKSWGIKIAIMTIAVVAIGGFLLSQQKPRVNAEFHVQEQMHSCVQKPERSKCYKQVASNLLSSMSLPEILKVFETNETNSEFFTSCHEVSHYLGQLEYKRLKSVGAVFLESSRGCLGGVYHGAIEGYFMEKGIAGAPPDTIKAEVAAICGKPADYPKLQEFTECNHGLGHAMMFIANYDLPKALNLCDALGTVNERELCYSGSLMANGDAFKSTEHSTKYIKADDPLYPCPILKPQQQRQCYTYGVLTRFQNDLEQSIKICAEIPSEFRQDCFETLGRDRTMISVDEKILKSQCDQISNLVYKGDCVNGVAYNLVIRFGLNSNLAQKFCSIVELKYQTDCYAKIERAKKKLN